MTKSAPPGCAASSVTDQPTNLSSAEAATAPRPRSTYLHRLALRREAAAVRQQTAYGLVMGWVLLVVAGFLYFCVPSRLDWLWAAIMAVGGLHLAAAVLLPQSLAWPERAWIGIARWQGWLVMTVLLTIVYFALIWPASYFSRRRTRGFVTWNQEPPRSSTAWEAIDLVEPDSALARGGRYRSLPLLLAGVVGFFFRRGDYVLLTIVILLVVLGLVLYFVQSSALAPFIYTLF
jgi:hypothetical protein